MRRHLLHGLALLLLAGAAQAQPVPALVVQPPDGPATVVDALRLAALPAITQSVRLGGADAAWQGPLLWEVLLAAGAVDPTKPAEQVRRVVRLTAADGYAVAFALAELSPAFANRPIQLALRRDGTPLTIPRLVVPGEARGGRSIRDVVRVVVE